MQTLFGNSFSSLANNIYTCSETLPWQEVFLPFYYGPYLEVLIKPVKVWSCVRQWGARYVKLKFLRLQPRTKPRASISSGGTFVEKQVEVSLDCVFVKYVRLAISSMYLCVLGCPLYCIISSRHLSMVSVIFAVLICPCGLSVYGCF